VKLPKELEVAVVRDPSAGWVACVSWDGEAVNEMRLTDYIGRGCQCRSLDDLKRIVAPSKSYEEVCDNIEVWDHKWVTLADSYLLDLETT